MELRALEPQSAWHRATTEFPEPHRQSLGELEFPEDHLTTSSSLPPEASLAVSPFLRWWLLVKRLPSLVAQLAYPPAMQETLVRFLGWEDPLEKGRATNSSFLGVPWWLSG